jgi:hypothetical protein
MTSSARFLILGLFLSTASPSANVPLLFFFFLGAAFPPLLLPPPAAAAMGCRILASMKAYVRSKCVGSNAEWTYLPHNESLSASS